MLSTRLVATEYYVHHFNARFLLLALPIIYCNTSPTATHNRTMSVVGFVEMNKKSVQAIVS